MTAEEVEKSHMKQSDVQSSLDQIFLTKKAMLSF